MDARCADVLPTYSCAAPPLNPRHGPQSLYELSAPWCARSFRTLHLQRISVALQLAAAEEILDTILLDRGAATRDGDAL